MNPDSMKPDPENADAGTDRVAPNTGNPSHFFAGHQPLIDRLHAEAGGYSWSPTRVRFEAALQGSAAKRFGSDIPAPETLEEYLGALHLQDLCLAAACADGDDRAWEHFISTYRSYLRSAAAAILRCSANSPAACDLADSLFADLYGLTDVKRSDRSLFRYFHGRSSLKTWLRAVLARRHIDAIRANRRFTDVDGEADPERRERILSRGPDGAARREPPPDPHRARYVALFTSALHLALGLLDPSDKERLRLYYAAQQTLAEIGRELGEHESSVSRNLDRIRHELRAQVESALRNGRVAANGVSAEPGLDEEQISLCFEYSAEDAPIDLDKLFPAGGSAPERLE
jgi:RNA polymerase sigma factor (sigma-70 family)